MKQTAQIDFTANSNGIPLSVTQRLMLTLRALSGQQVRITVQKLSKRRSDKQNRYYFGCVLPMVHEMFLDAGNTVNADQVHDYLKEHVAAVTSTIITPAGEVVTVPKSSADLTTTDWEKFMEAVRAWAAEFGVMIPLPNEQEYWAGVA